MDGFLRIPFYFSLVFLCIGMAGELKRELRRYNGRRKKVSLATEPENGEWWAAGKTPRYKTA